MVFPQRRRRAAIRLGIMVLFALNLVLSDARRALDQDGVGWTLLAALLCAISLVFVAGSLWPVITLRPVLTVDQAGIRLGRHELVWDEVGAVGVITGWQVLRSLPVIPRDVWAKSLSVPLDNVKDLEVFAGWLGELLAQQHQNDVQS
ncbi:hypothetical protein [Kribbella sp. VKM Ac-2568]|uniref:hypothetical protein n=1 Tax=Kribbella sp. VKM Ac-2568 TaxID=2512219 RepID=UPI00104F7661|nr:hypothetical protein [Kribbella sp. VKM Ac-2568]